MILFLNNSIQFFYKQLFCKSKLLFKTRFILSKLVLAFIFLQSCQTTVYDNSIPIEIVSLGGSETGDTICPSVYNDVIVPISSLEGEKGKNKLKVTTKGIFEYINKYDITSIPQLLNALPDHYRTNFSLVEDTKGEGQSDLNFPRIVLFGSDGRFLMNVGTKPEDPKYDLLDCAELDDETGRWVLSQLDFTKRKPQLIMEPQECMRCHGENEPRPIWGTSKDWPGVFGDNEAPGLSGDALSPRHIRRMNEIRDGHGGSQRFRFLKWKEGEELRSGGFRRIADNAFGVELIVSNLVIGSATGRGIFLRLKNKFPDKYLQWREALLLYAYHKNGIEVMDDAELSIFENSLIQSDSSKQHIDGVFEVLGIDVNESFSLGTLAEDEKEAITNWSLGDGDLYDQVFLQVLDDLSKTDEAIAELLVSTENTHPVFKCEGTVKNIRELIDYKMLHMYHLKGRARYEVNKVYYPLEVERVFDLVLRPIKDELVPMLKKRSSILNQKSQTRDRLTYLSDKD